MKDEGERFLCRTVFVYIYEAAGSTERRRTPIHCLPIIAYFEDFLVSSDSSARYPLPLFPSAMLRVFSLLGYSNSLILSPGRVLISHPSYWPLR